MNISTINKVIKYRTVKYINERRGWTTKRKIVVIESDDWGSVRMPNREVYEKMLQSGIRVDLSVINKYDTLASINDFEHLYSILSKYKDKNGNHPIITVNTIVANPDFDRIKASSFEEYYYEPFTKTLERYKNRSISSWIEGIDKKLIYPQLHGREHLNVERWMRFLRNGSKEVRFAFDNGLYGIGPNISLEKNPSFVPAFDSDVYLRKHEPENIIDDAYRLFADVFGFSSKSFIAPNYIWDERIEKALFGNNVKYLQGSFINKTATKENRYSYIGKTNKYGQIYTARNVHFEPSLSQRTNYVSNVIKQINNAFQLNKPAIISSHRYNFVGGVFEENRVRSLRLLDELLMNITKRWSNIEFMHSAQLGDLIIE